LKELEKRSTNRQYITPQIVPLLDIKHTTSCLGTVRVLATLFTGLADLDSFNQGFSTTVSMTLVSDTYPFYRLDIGNYSFTSCLVPRVRRAILIGGFCLPLGDKQIVFSPSSVDSMFEFESFVTLLCISCDSANHPHTPVPYATRGTVPFKHKSKCIWCLWPREGSSIGRLYHFRKSCKLSILMDMPKCFEV
jgi:hypothetical protein